MISPQLTLKINRGKIVVIFAGFGGMCLAIERALGRPVDAACNHKAHALAVHRINNVQTKHYICDVYELDPMVACEGDLCELLHLSPDCTDHSQAAGGQPRDIVSRSLSWVMLMWIGKLKKALGRGPRIITFENVKQIENWAPTVAKRCKLTGRVVKIDGSVAAPGERVPVQQQWLVNDPRRKGKRWRRLLSLAASHGYHFTAGSMIAADYGSRTSRDRLFSVFRCDELPAVIPPPTHSKTGKKPLKKWRSALECIDWSIKVPSIFDRPKMYVDATCRRLARGIVEQVLLHPNPCIVHGTAPLTMEICQTSGGHRPRPGSDPFPTMMSRPKGGHLALCAAFMAQHNGGNFADNRGHDLHGPFSTFTGRASQQQLVKCDLREFLTPSEEAGALRCAAFVMRYYSSGGQLGDLRMPMPTATTKDRLALVTVWIQGRPITIVDIGMRMFAARELARGMGFPESFILDRGIFELPDGSTEVRAISSTIQKELIGNAVAIEPAEALIRANASDLIVFGKGEREAIA